MSLGINALESILNRISKKTVSFGNQPVSVVYRNLDGSIDFPENCNSSGVLVVPRPFDSDISWELQNAIDDQNGKSSES